MSQQEELQSQLTWRFTGTGPQSREHVRAGPRLFTDSAGCLSLCQWIDLKTFSQILNNLGLL